MKCSSTPPDQAPSPIPPPRRLVGGRQVRPRLAVLGDVTLDIVARARADVETGTDVPGEIGFRPGGSAANTARVFAGLGGAATFIGSVGTDTLGRRLVAALRAAGVAVHAPRSRGSSARLLVLIDAAGERSFVTDRGVADRLRPEAMRASWLGRAQFLHMPAYSLLNAPLRDAAEKAARLARDAGAMVSVDLASRRPLLALGAAAARERVRAVGPDILFANTTEADALVGRGRARRLLELAPVVVIKEGAAGCRVLWQADGSDDVREIEVATKPITAADTTGAGDAFDAGFLYSLGAARPSPATVRGAAMLRRAAVAGHRAAARLLTSPRAELVL